MNTAAPAPGNRSRGIADRLTNLFLGFMAFNFNRRRSLNRYLYSDFGPFDFSVGIRTEDGSVERAIIVKEGRMRVSREIPPDARATLVFMDTSALREAATLPPNELMITLMKNRMVLEGNLGYVQLINLYLSLLMRGKQIRMLKKSARREGRDRSLIGKGASLQRKREPLRAPSRDRGVKHLEDPYLPELSLDDFPRLRRFLDIHFNTLPEICHERALLVTEWCRENGFETDASGKEWVPELRQAMAFRHLMENRKPIIRKDDLVAGTTTTREIGVVLYPDAHGTMIWGELCTVPFRPLNPYGVDRETMEILHHRVFPFWLGRNFREWTRETKGGPLCQRLDERFAVYFLWKTVALSHTIIDYPKILKKGTLSIIREIGTELNKTAKTNRGKRDTLAAMRIALEGLNAYALNLSRQAGREARSEKDPVRRRELERLEDICARVPMRPASTLDEAVNCVWIVWVAVHMENTNAGFSLGRLDRWLQPYFEKDMRKLRAPGKRREYVKRAVELIGCFYMRCTDHLPLIPDIGNHLFGGSSSDQAITLGGVTPEGGDAVNDMTYIFLKVTEMLSIRDPNVNARYNPEKNSEAYLRRLCEVNVTTTATPSIHNDEAVMKSLKEFRYPPAHLRDWSATGCVEPTISGKHLGHTNCMMFNMVAALEMALFNGRHPLMRWDVGPRTGDPAAGDFPGFEDFFRAFQAQFRFLAEQSVGYNNLLGEAHAVLRPTPLISSVIEGPIRSGKDVTRGGARYNSSGTACIGLADVTDSLMVVRNLVYNEKRVSFPALVDAVRTNFRSDPALLAMVKNRVPLFGSGDPDALAMANRIARFAHDCFGSFRNFRGGRYTAGFWSMSNHVAFGTLTGALPSGRLAGKAFTPGLTPEAHASKSLLDNIRDVAKLDPASLNNNIAFNVKVVPATGDSHAETVDHLHSYAKTYCDLGGMQMQFNVVSSATLRDAMARPEHYQNLLVRISGYNAYFVTLNREMQMELIERAEYGL
ncbi:MAG: formate acetyltransferase [Spirochaetes bacterium]|nr:formate acetyltransferase [Spirochaetota bacterium]